jgi:hypothetical protein
VKPERRSQRTNRLIDEKSPYLQQHASNPVDWYPWGREAFDRARREDWPVFLSIGYSACHWCHVMEAESFADDEVAGFLNRHFVSVKVDREERPDVDHIYMTACQAMTGSGGWPLTIVMTPGGQPFFAGTYFPRRSKYGRPGLLQVLRQIADLWQQDRRRLLQAGAHMAEALERLSAGACSEGRLSQEILEQACKQLAERFDADHGGFGPAPKFPAPHNLSLLLRWWRRSGQPSALEMVTRTLDGMRRGGIYDHLGFGFHRYSTDDRWRVPHFEKMLYDQALLSLAYLEAYQATADERYARVAREIFRYVLRDMTAPQGGFCSAEDADSEGREGSTYVWTPDQLRSVLGKDSGDRFGRFFGVTGEGNFEDGASVLHRSVDLKTFAAQEGLSPRELERFLENARQKLLRARQERTAPLKDDKILTDWNGLMIAALARGGFVLKDPAYAQAARRAADFIFSRLRDEHGRLLHRYSDGQATIGGFLDDHAFLLWALIELYETTYLVEYLEKALRVARRMEELFRDEQGGGFFLTAQGGESLLLRPREITDGALPSGSSVAALSLLRLGRLTARSDLEDRARQTMDAAAAQAERVPTGFSHLLMALDFALGPVHEVVIAGAPGGKETRRLLDALRSRFMPNTVVLLHAPGPKGKVLEKIVPAVKGQVPVEGRAAAYVCRDFACRRPVTDADQMIARMESPRSSRDSEKT